MSFKPNQWNAIRKHYAEHQDAIQRAGRNEWGIGAYDWDQIVFLTPIEKWFWQDIRACDAVMYPQYPVGPFFLDFANPVAKVAIECDGAAYHLGRLADAERDAFLAGIGWRVYRITGVNCRTEEDSETLSHGFAYSFMQNICLQHGISRDSRTIADERAARMY